MFQSKTFRFIVGPDREEFILHSAAVTSHSKPLHAMMENGMQEAREGEASLPNVDVDTFTRFCHFLYSANYEAAEPSKEEMSADSQGGDEQDDSEFQEWYTEYNRKTARNRAGTPWATFSRHDYGVSSVELKANSNPDDDYTDVLLSHAKVYAFADVWDVERLKALALSKLRDTLAVFILHAKRARDICALLKFTYDHTAERVAGLDELRQLVIVYVASFVEKLVDLDDFRQTLSAHGAAGVDLVSVLLQRFM